MSASTAFAGGPSPASEPQSPAAGAATRLGRLSTRPWRRVALLGGTTTAGDAAAALNLLVHPRALINGDDVHAFEAAFARRHDAAGAAAFSHGRVALYALLRTLGVGPGDEVLLQAPTHIVVANAIRYTGARPVFIDCDPATFNMNLALAERAVTPRTRVLLLQHTFGIPADLDRALSLCRRHGVELIEDCVHALGATYGGQPVGSFGRAAFFSTEETKTISTTMGGMAIARDATLAAALHAFRDRCAPPTVALTARYMLKLAAYHVLTQPDLHRVTRALYERLGRRNPLPGPTTREEVRGDRPRSYLMRFSNAQARLGLRQLERLDANLSHRANIAAVYAERLRTHGVTPPAIPAGAVPAFVRYPVWTADGERAARAIEARAVPGRWFTSVLEEAETPAAGGYVEGSCPVAEAMAGTIVNLPTHERVTPGDAAAIAEALGPVVGTYAMPGTSGTARGIRDARMTMPAGARA